MHVMLLGSALVSRSLIGPIDEGIGNVLGGSFQVEAAVKIGEKIHVVLAKVPGRDPQY